MDALCVFVERSLSIDTLEYQSEDSFKFGDRIYTRRLASGCVFYDWIVDDSNVPRGLEIHLSPNDPLLRTPDDVSDHIVSESLPFFGVWLGGSRQGTPQAMEAFGDIEFFEDRSGNLAIVVGLDMWLTSDQKESIRRLAGVLTLHPVDVSRRASLTTPLKEEFA